MATRKAYYKNDREVVKPRSLSVSGVTYLPPTDKILLANGYEIKEVDVPQPTPYMPTYEEKVVQLIREKYSIDDELAILRQRDVKAEEFAEYNAYCEECKTKAKEV